MLSFQLRWLLPAGMSLIVAPVQAQADATNTAPHVALQYRSVLEQYRRFDDQPVAPWRETNDTVGKIGGWRTYAREARQPAPASENAAPAAPGAGVQPDPARPMPGSHMGHGGKP